MEVLNQSIGKNYSLYHGDSCEVLKAIPDNSIHYTVTSPPFSSLYTYSSSDRDMGNSADDGEFFHHFKFLVKELFRVTMSGRLISLHCMNLPCSIQRDGFIGTRDFRGDLIRLFHVAGFIYHSEVLIWRDPVVAMQRTKAIGLLHKQLVKDSSISRQGYPDYLVQMRKPGKNPEPIAGHLEYYVGDDTPKKSGDEVRDSINIWQRYASPVWYDINQSDTLQYKTAREGSDERHICPLQFQVIERGMQLWSNPGDVVLDPFNGIGSTGYVALKSRRKYIGCELKESYYNESVLNLQSVDVKQPNLLDLLQDQEVGAA